MVFGIGYDAEKDANTIISVFEDLRKNFHSNFKTKKFFIGNDFVKYFKNDYVYEDTISAKVSPTKRIPETASITFRYHASEDLYFHTLEFMNKFSFRCYRIDADGFEAVMKFSGANISYTTKSFHPDYIDGTGTMSSRKATKLSGALLEMVDGFVDTSSS